MQKITKTVSTTLDEILEATPVGKIAMFTVSSISSNVDDGALTLPVYVYRDRVWDFISDNELGPVSEFGLHFCRYIDR